NFSGFPGSNVNRVLLGANVSQEDWVEYYNDRKDMMAPADLEMDGVYQYGTRELNLDVTTNFYTDIDEAHFALSVIVVENGVSGTDSNWGQSNYYSGGSQGPMGGFENLPQVVPASDMVYDRVGRAIIGGYYGEEGSIPSAVSDGDSPSYSFTYT